MVDANEETDQTVAQLFQANVQAMGFDLELISVDYATIESVYGDAPPEERPHYRRWGWWPDYNDPGTSSGRTSPRPTLAAADQTAARGSIRASRRSWPRRSTSRARSNSTN